MSSSAIFAKEERLKSKKLVEKLFKEGKVLHLPPLRVIYLPCDILPNHQVLFAVPSKKEKSAVRRNVLKRKMREAYRLNKYLLKTSPKSYFLLGYIYNGSGKPCRWKTISEKVIGSFRYLNSYYAPNE